MRRYAELLALKDQKMKENEPFEKRSQFEPGYSLHGIIADRGKGFRNFGVLGLGKNGRK